MTEQPRVAEEATNSRYSTTKWLTFYAYLMIFWVIVAAGNGVLTLVADPRAGNIIPMLIAGPVAVFVAFVGFGLLWREDWAWKANWVLLFLPLIVSTLVTIVAVTETMTGKGTVKSKHELFILYITLTVNVAWVWPNYVYFRRRRHLFL